LERLVVINRNRWSPSPGARRQAISCDQDALLVFTKGINAILTFVGRQCAGDHINGVLLKNGSNRGANSLCCGDISAEDVI
jgi:hypothetical protein